MMLQPSPRDAFLPSVVRAADLVARYGGDSATLLAHAGIDCGLLNTPEATLEHVKLIGLLEIAVRTQSAASLAGARQQL